MSTGDNEDPVFAQSICFLFFRLFDAPLGVVILCWNHRPTGIICSTAQRSDIACTGLALSRDASGSTEQTRHLLCASPKRLTTGQHCLDSTSFGVTCLDICRI